MDVFQSILQRVGIRQLPGICWYPAKRTGYTVNQGGTAGGEILPVLDRRLYQDSVMDGFFVRKIFCEPIRAENWRKKWKH